jgi:hypothetical protein
MVTEKGEDIGRFRASLLRAANRNNTKTKREEEGCPNTVRFVRTKILLIQLCMLSNHTLANSMPAVHIRTQVIF